VAAGQADAKIPFSDRVTMTLGQIASMLPRGGSSAVPSAERVLPGPLSAGSLVAGRYRLVGVAGRGATGTVWRARDELLNRDVALKNFLGSAHGARVEACLLRVCRRHRGQRQSPLPDFPKDSWPPAPRRDHSW
jgi:hypothetical protein